MNSTWSTRLLVIGTAVAWAAGALGCASSETTDRAAAEQGPPPEGFETWEDYWQAKDQEFKDFERDRREFQMTRPRVPGGTPR